MSSTNLPMHLVNARPQTTRRLPRGWYEELKLLYAPGPEGFVALAAEPPADLGPPAVLAWGTDYAEALAAAEAAGKHPKSVIIIPCSQPLREEIAGSKSGMPNCWHSRIGVAFSQAEASPEEIADDWVAHTVVPAHGEAVRDEPERELAWENWERLMGQIEHMALAYLTRHPAVELARDGRIGWTAAAALRDDAGADGIAPLPNDPDEAQEQIDTNLWDLKTSARI